MRTLLAAALVALLALAAAACGATAPPAAEPAPAPVAGRDAAADLVPFEADDGRYGYTRGEGGAVVLPAVYGFAYGFSAESGLAAVVEDGRWALIDATGRVVWRPFVFDNGPDYVSEGYTRYVDDDGRVGFLDAAGNAVIPARFTWAGPFEGGRARYCMGCTASADDAGEHTRFTGGRWGWVTPSGEVAEDEPRP